MALVKLLPQLRSRSRSGGEIDIKVCDTVCAVSTAENKVRDNAGLAPLDILTTQESETRPRPQAGAVCVCAGEKPLGQKHDILLNATGAGLRGTSRDFAGLPRDFAGLRGTSRDFAGLRGTSREFDINKKYQSQGKKHKKSFLHAMCVGSGEVKIF